MVSEYVIVDELWCRTKWGLEFFEDFCRSHFRTMWRSRSWQPILPTFSQILITRELYQICSLELFFQSPTTKFSWKCWMTTSARWNSSQCRGLLGKLSRLVPQTHMGMYLFYCLLKWETRKNCGTLEWWQQSEVPEERARERGRHLSLLCLPFISKLKFKIQYFPMTIFLEVSFFLIWGPSLWGTGPWISLDFLSSQW